MDIEKAYWGIKGSSGRFDETVLLNIMSPPLPEALCKSKSFPRNELIINLFFFFSFPIFLFRYFSFPGCQL